jgi:hypothetical protein
LSWLIGGLIQAVPLVQRHNADLGFRFAGKLGDELQEMAVWIVEVDLEQSNPGAKSLEQGQSHGREDEWIDEARAHAFCSCRLFE